MGDVNLAKVFGYTLVGNSCLNPSVSQMADEVGDQQSVGHQLISIITSPHLRACILCLSAFISCWCRLSSSS